MRQEKIFGIGLSRTGTTSLHVALLLLGKASIHYPKNLARFWLAGNFNHSHLAEFDAVTDLPTAAYFRELDAHFPGSRFILTVRNENDWINSVANHFRAGGPSNRNTVMRDMIRLACYGTISFEENRFRRIFRQHNETVHSHFKDRPGSLLTLDMTKGDGWEKLCTFLGCDVPEYAFPHLRSPKLGKFESVRRSELKTRVGELLEMLDASRQSEIH